MPAVSAAAAAAVVVVVVVVVVGGIVATSAGEVQLLTWFRLLCLHMLLQLIDNSRYMQMVEGTHITEQNNRCI